MKRRSFLSALAALPFLPKLLKKQEALTGAKPRQSEAEAYSDFIEGCSDPKRYSDALDHREGALPYALPWSYWQGPPITFTRAELYPPLTGPVYFQGVPIEMRPAIFPPGDRYVWLGRLPAKPAPSEPLG